MKVNVKILTAVTSVILMLLSTSLSCAAAAARPLIIVDIKQEAVAVRPNDEQEIFKLIFSVNSHDGVSVLSTVMSYDNDVIVPVNNITFQDADSFIMNLGNYALSHKVLLTSSSLGGFAAPYSVAGIRWVLSGTRTGVLYDIFSTDPILSMNSSEPAFEFYFRLADGKSEADMNNSTFRIETDKSTGSILAALFTTPDSLNGAAGIFLSDNSAGSNAMHFYDGGTENSVGLSVSYTNSTKPPNVEAGSETTLPFKDVSLAGWYYEAVKFVSQKGLFNGTSADTFSPGLGMTRAMFVTVLGRLEKIDVQQYQGSTFTDVQTEQWYSPYIKWAAEKGIVDGYGNNTFGTDDLITREQMATIMARYLNKMNIQIDAVLENLPPFEDSGKISEWAVDAVRLMQAKGLIQGVGNNRFAPKDTATRAQAATIIMKLSQALGVS